MNKTKTTHSFDAGTFMRSGTCVVTQMGIESRNLVFNQIRWWYYYYSMNLIYFAYYAISRRRSMILSKISNKTTMFYLFILYNADRYETIVSLHLVVKRQHLLKQSKLCSWLAIKWKARGKSVIPCRLLKHLVLK